LPRDWAILQVYFAITIIISLVGWTELGRVVRGRLLALREEDFILAARLSGCSELRIIFVHMVPSFMSHIIAATTLALPAMIISETLLSFLGLGLRPPAISWGVLLQQAQNVQTVAISPWLMLPAVPVIIAVMAFNFLGDGLRDAADPYGRRGPVDASVFPGSEDLLHAGRGHREGGRRRELRPLSGGHPRHRGGKRLRQERHRPVDSRNRGCPGP